jgi:pimeloyl-ACP methyl ester carboxylesterase
VYQTVLATWWHAGLYVGKGTDAVDPTLGNPLVDRSCRFHRERSVSGLASEARDIARHMPGQTFAIVGDAHVRYRLLRAKLPGADVVVPSGLKGSIEQAKDFQWAVSSAVPSLAYDRAGYGFNEGSTAHSAELTRRLVVRFLIVALALVASTLLTELALEARDVARYMPGQTFATVGDARIRYRLLGAERPGATVVFLSGLNGSIEQADHFQRAVSSAVPSLAYDRAGYGFSEGSTAHSAEQQAKELAALLHALKLEGSVVLVAYSISSLLARVFADRFPEKTAGIYLIEPVMPELNERMPQHPTAPLRELHRASAAGQLARLHPSHPARTQLARPSVTRRAACGGGAGAATALLGASAGMVRPARIVATSTRQRDTPLAAPRGGLYEARSRRGNFSG